MILTSHIRRAVLAIMLLTIVGIPAAGSGSPWGGDYFPNVLLTTQDGDDVRFFDDLIKDKIVAINFIYTSCPDTCPLETAQLTRVQRLLGDRLGKDVFFYSISIDPEHDTPDVLAEYRERFGARWTFLTGDNDDIVQLRRKLGLYVEEIQDGSNNHNVNMIIGNQATGRWMKRSPFENPHVLADQLGNWLSGWTAPPVGDDYANAPTLRNISPGERLYRTRCTSCHTLTGDEPDDALGPDLLGVTQRRQMDWLLNWLRAPDQMLRKKDPIAMNLAAKYNFLPMPNMRLTQQEATDLLDYIDSETLRLSSDRGEGERRPVSSMSVSGESIEIRNAWVREADAEATANAGYMTLVNVGSDEITLIKVESEAFESIDIHEMSATDGLMTMRELPGLIIPAKGRARLSPGGKHLMLRGPRQYLAAGTKIDLTLTFDSGRRQTVSIEVYAN